MVLKIILASLTSLALLGCSDSSNESGNKAGDNGNNNPQKKSYVLWDLVSSEFNPSTEDIDFKIDGVEKLNINAFGFDKDVEVIYSKDILPNEGVLRVFKVWKKQASWGDLRPRPNGKNLDLKNYGSNYCSIRVQNGQITELEGGCYVRLQVFMPIGSEVEVYNVGQLITKRFIPISNELFFEEFNGVVWPEEKFIVIENFLASYSGSKKASLTAFEIGLVVKNFTKSEDKFKALRKLHIIASDRENLGEMIDKEFSYFDRVEAKNIVGLN